LKEKSQKSRDTLFSEEIEKQFQFDEGVASVFDDMLERSVPFYRENIDLSIEIIYKFLEDGDAVVDLGCSTASFLLEVERKVEKSVNLIGIDNSQPMLEQAKRKISAYSSKIELLHGDILNIKLPKSKVVVLNYTLQFIRPIERERLLKNILESLESGGVLILSEKIFFQNPKLQKDITDIYYRFKRDNGYSQYEITQKREALENILVPYTKDENIKLLKSVGFSTVDTIFQWGNFATFIGVVE
jgi:tRNA (cmo5U34)-methyltransferase